MPGSEAGLTPTFYSGFFDFMPRFMPFDLPRLARKASGFGVLEHAAKVLETRRGEAERVAGGRLRVESRRATAAAAEAFVKHPSQRKCSMLKFLP